MSYRVEVSEAAEQDADGIYVWLYGRSPDGAQRWWEAFLAALENLKVNAAGHSLAAEADHFDEPLRLILFRTRRGHDYRALFVVRDDVVHLLRVRGAGQNLVEPDDIELPE